MLTNILRKKNSRTPRVRHAMGAILHRLPWIYIAGVTLAISAGGKFFGLQGMALGLIFFSAFYACGLNKLDRALFSKN